jgi:hypothetical protein
MGSENSLASALGHVHARDQSTSGNREPVAASADPSTPHTNPTQVLLTQIKEAYRILESDR